MVADATLSGENLDKYNDSQHTSLDEMFIKFGVFNLKWGRVSKNEAKKQFANAEFITIDKSGVRDGTIYVFVNLATIREYKMVKPEDIKAFMLENAITP